MTLLAGLGGAGPTQVEPPRENRSRAYRGLLAPGLVGFGLGSLVGFTALAGGWSPPFALVDHNRH